MKKTKYKLKIAEIIIRNRYKTKWFLRPSSWVIFGFGVDIPSINMLRFYIALFGIEINFWFDRIYDYKYYNK